MCGIAGFTHAGRRVDETVITRMTVSLTHRGPDQQACYSSADVALGAVRLKVIDASGGDQPMLSDDGHTAIVYNGEIYNFREIRRELESLGHRFRSHCDTEVALRAFIEWDTDCFRRFRGMFAMALWSGLDRRLVLARDRMGIKPLYVRRIGRDIAFGSELKALFAHPGITRRLDHRALHDFLSLNYVPAPRTLVEGIEKLPSGHFLEWRNGIERTSEWWRPEFRPDATITADDAACELDRLLRDSVREHLVSDVPLGIWASGGLDSTTLLHYAAEAAVRPLKTFSVSFESPSCDERQWFRLAAKWYRTEHYEVELNRASDVASAVGEFATFSDEPGADAGALPVWFLSKLTRRHVTVALSGEGGDELFGGYMTYRADRLTRALRRVPRLLRQGALGAARSLLPVTDAKIGFEYKLKRWLEGSMLRPDEAHLFWNGAFSREQKQSLLPAHRSHGLSHLYSDVPSSADIGFLNRFLAVDQKFYLQDNLLYKVDRMSMAHSLEVRPPLLDHRIVEFAARLPEHLKVSRLHQKAILKKTMRGKLPDAILNRGKAGLDIPAHEWLRGPLYPLLRDTLTPEAIRSTFLFDADVTQSLIRDHRDKRINAGYHLWGLMTLFLWLKRWNIEVAPREEQPLREAASLVAAN